MFWPEEADRHGLLLMPPRNDIHSEDARLCHCEPAYRRQA